MYNIYNIANYLIEKCPDITNMKLQKLVYYAYVDYLMSNNKKLIKENLEAWVYGHVIRELYMEFSKYSYKKIKISPKGNSSILNKDIISFLDSVIEIYGHLDANELSDKVHGELPWQEAYKNSDWSLNIIKDSIIKEFYI